MRRKRNNSIKKERIIMLASSAFVLAALTMTGVYMKEQNAESQDDGYTLDFTALDNSAGDKYEELAGKNQITEQAEKQLAQNKQNQKEDAGLQPELSDDLDYMPMEVGSSQIEIPGLTASGELLEQEEKGVLSSEIAGEEPVLEEVVSDKKVVVERKLSFSEEEGLLRPVEGEVLLPYSMDASIYFPTLAQYKYNPALVIAASEGTQVTVCAAGRVIDIYEDAQIGRAVTLDLGNGYQATYGQLADITAVVDSYVEKGEVLGVVSAPTKYYSVEGANLYFQLTRDGEAVNPEELFE